MTMLRNLFNRVGARSNARSIAITAMWPALASVTRRPTRPKDMQQLHRAVNRYGQVG